MILGKRDKQFVEDLKAERLELIKYSRGLEESVQDWQSCYNDLKDSFNLLESSYKKLSDEHESLLKEKKVRKTRTTKEDKPIKTTRTRRTVKKDDKNNI